RAMAALGSPNRTGVMNSLPPEHRGAGSGMNTTFQNSAQVFSIGIFFTLMIVGLSSTLPHSLYHGLPAHGVPSATGASALAASASWSRGAMYVHADPVVTTADGTAEPTAVPAVPAAPAGA